MLPRRRTCPDRVRPSCHVALRRLKRQASFGSPCDRLLAVVGPGQGNRPARWDGALFPLILPMTCLRPDFGAGGTAVLPIAWVGVVEEQRIRTAAHLLLRARVLSHKPLQVRILLPDLIQADVLLDPRAGHAHGAPRAPGGFE